MANTPFVPEINLIVMGITTVLYTLGCLYYGNKNPNKKKHFIFSFAGWIGTLVFFIIYMASRTTGASAGVPGYFTNIYYPFLYIHMITATITLVFPAYLLYLGLKQRKGNTDKSMKTIGNINLILWYLTFISGIIVYIGLHVLS
jgi:uncharacterized membrane protein YozB (DUF420 family)